MSDLNRIFGDHQHLHNKKELGVLDRIDQTGRAKVSLVTASPIGLLLALVGVVGLIDASIISAFIAVLAYMMTGTLNTKREAVGQDREFWLSGVEGTNDSDDTADGDD
jgi:hypothetical protein